VPDLSDVASSAPVRRHGEVSAAATEKSERQDPTDEEHDLAPQRAVGQGHANRGPGRRGTERTAEIATPPGRLGRASAALLAVLLALALPPAGASADEAPQPRGTDRICTGEPVSEFDDIDGNAHEDTIRCMADRGLTEGVDDDGYAPRRAVRRDQMASFIARFIEDYTGRELGAGDGDRFDDVSEDNVHRANIAKLAEIDVVGGTGASDGASYAPAAPITRGQMAALIRRALSWLDDGEARNSSAPEDARKAWFDDTEGSVHEGDIDALAEQGIVAGFEDGDYRPQRRVLRDQMASFVMRGYDFAIEADLGEGPDAPPAEVAAILDPTAEQPLFPVAPGDELDITFSTDRDGGYVLQYRDPAPEGGGFPLLPVPGDDGPGPWTDFEGDAAAGEVEAGTTEATVTLPSAEEDEGVRDLRLIFEYGNTRLTVTETAALIVGDGVVINLTQETIELGIQEAVDAADDADRLLAIGEFSELVEIEGLQDLSLGALPGTTLEGSVVVDDADGLSISDLTITGYETLGPLAPITGDEVGIDITGSEGVTLAELTLRGDGDDVALRAEDVAGDVIGSTFEGNGVGVLLGEAAAGLEVGAGNVFTRNGIGVDLDVVDATVTTSTFDSNETGVRAGAGLATVNGNAFDDHGEVAVDLVGAGATVVGNAFGPADAEHLCFDADQYRADDLVAANAFAYGPDPEVRGEDPTCIGPPADDADNGEEESGTGLLPLP
jgi:hypothetical protein